MSCSCLLSLGIASLISMTGTWNIYIALFVFVHEVINECHSQRNCLKSLSKWKCLVWGLMSMWVGLPNNCMLLFFYLLIFFILVSAGVFFSFFLISILSDIPSGSIKQCCGYFHLSLKVNFSGRIVLVWSIGPQVEFSHQIRTPSGIGHRTLTERSSVAGEVNWSARKPNAPHHHGCIHILWRFFFSSSS